MNNIDNTDYFLNHSTEKLLKIKEGTIEVENDLKRYITVENVEKLTEKLTEYLTYNTTICDNLIYMCIIYTCNKFNQELINQELEKRNNGNKRIL